MLSYRQLWKLDNELKLSKGVILFDITMEWMNELFAKQECVICTAAPKAMHSWDVQNPQQQVVFNTVHKTNGFKIQAIFLHQTTWSQMIIQISIEQISIDQRALQRLKDITNIRKQKWCQRSRKIFSHLQSWGDFGQCITEVCTNFSSHITFCFSLLAC